MEITKINGINEKLTKQVKYGPNTKITRAKKTKVTKVFWKTKPTYDLAAARLVKRRQIRSAVIRAWLSYALPMPVFRPPIKCLS